MNKFCKIFFFFLVISTSLNLTAEITQISSATFKSNTKHQVQLLDVGAPSLYSMLKIIHEAHSSVFITNYLINYWDYSALYILDAILNKKKQNPDFHAYFLLEDSTSATGGYSAFNHWQWRELIQILKERGLEFRIFNPRAFSPANSNVRQHQKIIAADTLNSKGEIEFQMIIGGRNFSDDYYGFVPHYNRLDKEIYVKGEIVQQAITEFMIQWNGEKVFNILNLSEEADRKIDEDKARAETIYERGASRDNFSSGLKEIKDYILGGPDELTFQRLRWVKSGADNLTIIYSDKVLQQLKRSSRVFYEKSGEAIEVRYSDIFLFKTNPPKNVNLVSEKDFFAKLKAEYEIHSLSENYPLVEVSEIVLGYDQPGTFLKQNNFIPFFYKTLSDAQSEIYFENQYFIPSDSAIDVLNGLMKKNVHVHFLTNSLVSQDESNPGILTHDEIRDYQKLHPQLFHAYAFRGQNLQGIRGALWWDATARNKENTWQIHAKAVVIDEKSSWVGSNNFDNRSEDFNPEMAIFIPNNEFFAKQLKKSILNNIRNADKMEIDSKYWLRYEEKVKGVSILEKVKSSAWGFLLQMTQPFW